MSARVYAGTLDDPSAFRPTHAVMMADRAPWAAVLDGLELHDGLPTAYTVPKDDCRRWRDPNRATWGHAPRAKLGLAARKRAIIASLSMRLNYSRFLTSRRGKRNGRMEL